jgi:predicted permease
MRWVEDLRLDLRYGVRGLLREKRFAATALVTLAVGIGATTATFSVFSALVLRPLPFAEPGRLVQVFGTSPLSDSESIGYLDDYRQDTDTFEALAGSSVGAAFLRDAAGAHRVMTVQAEPDFFAILNVPALHGRTFDRSDAANVVVVSEAFWRQRLGGQPSAIGSSLILDGASLTVIGVVPSWFQFPYSAASLLPGVASQARTDAWMPEQRPSPPARRRAHVIARLKRGVSLQVAQARVLAIATRVETTDPARNTGRSARIVPLSQSVVGAPVRRVLVFLFGAGALVLALACANVVNLSLARMTVRGRELALRSALGAPRGRLVRQLLAESVVLSALGGALGLALARIGLGRILGLAAPYVPRAHEVALDWRVFGFLLAACGTTAVIVGLAPALMGTRRDLRDTLQETGGHTTPGRSQRWLRDSLVVAEIAMALLLAVGTSVLIRELLRLWETTSGMTTRNVLTLHLGYRPLQPFGAMPPNQGDIRPYYEIEQRALALPGVRAAGFTQLLPLQNWGWTSSSRDFRLRGEEPSTPEFPIQLRYVTPGYFGAQGMTLVKGRGFTASDSVDTPSVIVVNETLARRSFSARDPIGLTTTRGVIVGVVGDVRQVHLDRPSEPEVYYPMAQNWAQVSELGMTLVVRTQEPPLALADRIRTVVREVNPNLAVFDVKTMEQVVAESVSDFTLSTSLVAGFATVALMLALTGTYGVVSLTASSRVREFAIRMALGANRARIVRSVLTQGAILSAGGLALGTAAVLAAAPLLENLPVTVRQPDMLAIAPVALLLGTIALAASAVPARRAARADLMVVLRNE